MAVIRKRGEMVRKYILENLESHSTDIVNITSKKFGISRQAVNKHMRKLQQQEAIRAEGSSRNRLYFLCLQEKQHYSYILDGTVEEDVIWRTDIFPHVEVLSENARSIWNYGVTEILNNAIEHSDGVSVTVSLEKTATNTIITIYDDGEGIFRKIKRELGLLDERHSLLELAKGKLTTDPENHTGEGIFFSSRMFDDFVIRSGRTFFSHNSDDFADWMLEGEEIQEGTLVRMALSNNTSRTTKQVFDSFTSDENYGFTKTVVPVKLAQYGDDQLVSRSQAKRLLQRIDRFKKVVFVFDGVDMIGQAFADEIFRVFKNNNPEIDLVYLKANPDVEQMIKRALAHS